MATARQRHEAFERWFEPKTGMDVTARAQSPYERFHGDGIVYRRHTYEWILPADVGPHLKYDKRLLPVPIMVVDITSEHVHIWEWTAEKTDWDRRVYARGRDNEDYYLHISARRILRGYRGGTSVERVSFV